MLVENPGNSGPRSFRTDDLKKLNSARELSGLTTLLINGIAFENLSHIQDVRQIEELIINNNYRLKDISALRNFYRLKKLKLGLAHSHDLSPLKEISTLRDLSITSLGDLEFAWIRNLTNLENLTVGTNLQLDDIDEFRGLKKLKRLTLIGKGLDNIEGIRGSESLIELTLNCQHLTDMDVISSLKNLRVLNLVNCESLRGFSGASALKNLEELNLNNMSLHDIDKFVVALPNLRKLTVRHPKQLETLENFESLTRLKELVVENCPNLREISAIESLTRLEKTVLIRCPKITKTKIAQMQAKMPNVVFESK